LLAAGLPDLSALYLQQDTQEIHNDYSLQARQCCGYDDYYYDDDPFTIYEVSAWMFILMSPFMVLRRR
jgi:hypothetical protein